MQELRSYRPPYATATSMITLIVPPTFQLPLLRQRINHEMTTADNIRNTSNSLEQTIHRLMFLV